MRNILVRTLVVRTVLVAPQQWPNKLFFLFMMSMTLLRGDKSRHCVSTKVKFKARGEILLQTHSVRISLRHRNIFGSSDFSEAETKQSGFFILMAWKSIFWFVI